MSEQKLNLEIFSSPYCEVCVKAMEMARSVIAEIGSDNIELRKVDIVEEKDYAVELGLIWAPAVAINGKIHFRLIPSKAELKQSLLEMLGAS